MLVKNRNFARLNVKNCGGQIISNRIKLLATLRWLAGGMMWDVTMYLKIGWGTFFTDSDFGVIWPTMRAIDVA